MHLLDQGLGRYLSPEQLLMLGQVRVGIAGAGGLGSNVAFMLVRSGIRHITLVDNDQVDASNLNRQAYFPEDLGLLKVEALAKWLLRLCPNLAVSTQATQITAHNAVPLFAGCPLVVEALDAAEAKAMLYTALLPAGFLYVGASGLGGVSGAPMTIRQIHTRAVCVGDFVTQVGVGTPPLAPRVVQAAALQAEAVLSCILNGMRFI